MARTILTVVGVVVGVCAIVVMISLGIAVNRATDEMLQNWGDLTKIEVMRYGAQMGTPALDDRMVEQLSNIENVVAVTPMYQTWEFWGKVTTGTGGRFVNDGPQLIGMIPSALEPMGYTLITGSWDIESNLGRNRIPVLVGEQVIFGFRDSRKSWGAPGSQIWPEWDETWTTISNLPVYDENGVLLNPEVFFFDIMKARLTYEMEIGWDETTQTARTRTYELVPVGMISGGSGDWMISNGIIMSLDNIKFLENEYRRASGTTGGGGGSGWGGGWISPGRPGDGGETTTVEGYDTVYVKVNDVRNVAAVETAIRQIGYQIYSMSEIRNQMQGQVAQTQLMLGGLAAVSLFVAALNIMNTMTMAITERTREIGVMKVLGCKLGNIRMMFLSEAAYIGVFGGALGLIVSYLLSYALNNVSWLRDVVSTVMVSTEMYGASGGTTSIIPPELGLGTWAFVIAVSIFSGFFPARRAMRLSSLAAIRGSE